jgi:signal transduction histidine kinase
MPLRTPTPEENNRNLQAAEDKLQDLLNPITGVDHHLTPGIIRDLGITIVTETGIEIVIEIDHNPEVDTIATNPEDPDLYPRQRQQVVQTT